MRVFVDSSLLGRQVRRCHGCLGVLLKSLCQVFNPKVETGPGRLTNQHRYADGIMPDYPANGARCKGCHHVDRTADTLAARGERDAPTADYVDGGDGGKGRGDGDKGVVVAESGGGNDSGYVTGEQPFTDFIVSLLETFQLTSRATLKRSEAKAAGKLDLQRQKQRYRTVTKPPLPTVSRVRP